jgi:hypothetical protein
MREVRKVRRLGAGQVSKRVGKVEKGEGQER